MFQLMLNLLGSHTEIMFILPNKQQKDKDFLI